MQLYCYFVSQSSEFCGHNPLCYFSVSECCSCCCLFHYRLSPETFRYTLVYHKWVCLWWLSASLHNFYSLLSEIAISDYWLVSRSRTFGSLWYHLFCIHEESKILLPFCLQPLSFLSAFLNSKIKIPKTKILHFVSYGCKTWPFTLGEECRWRIFDNSVLRRIFGAMRQWQDTREDCIMRSFITCTLHQILEWSNQEEWDGQDM
jgi:hypothetical protein